jgi:hypothetical protein
MHGVNCGRYMRPRMLSDTAPYPSVLFDTWVGKVVLVWVVLVLVVPRLVGQVLTLWHLILR